MLITICFITAACVDIYADKEIAYAIGDIIRCQYANQFYNSIQSNSLERRDSILYRIRTSAHHIHASVLCSVCGQRICNGICLQFAVNFEAISDL